MIGVWQLSLQLLVLAGVCWPRQRHLLLLALPLGWPQLAWTSCCGGM